MANINIPTTDSFNRSLYVAIEHSVDNLDSYAAKVKYILRNQNRINFFLLVILFTLVTMRLHSLYYHESVINITDLILLFSIFIEFLYFVLRVAYPVYDRKVKTLFIMKLLSCISYGIHFLAYLLCSIYMQANYANKLLKTIEYGSNSTSAWNGS